MTIQDIINKYCVTTDPPGRAPGEMAPFPRNLADMSNHRCQYYIDGEAFFAQIAGEIDFLLDLNQPGSFMYIAGWWHDLFPRVGKISVKGSIFPSNPTGKWKTNTLEMKGIYPPGTSQPFLDRFVELTQSQVDVRMLGWVSPLMDYKVVSEKLPHFMEANFATALSIQELRNRTQQPDRFMLNTCAHSLGGAHSKLIIVGNGDDFRAYTSGLDFVGNRISPFWHDVGVLIEGRAAGNMYDFFQELWAEQLSQPKITLTLDDQKIVSHESSWAQVPNRNVKLLPPGTGKQYVQVLRTLPQMNFNQAGARRRGAFFFPDNTAVSQQMRGAAINLSRFQRKPLSMAPHGVFEFKVALKKAISEAEEYIFIIDQSLYCLELLGWLGAAMRSKPNLKVILVTGTPVKNGFISRAVNQFLEVDKLPKQANGIPRQLVFYEWKQALGPDPLGLETFDIWWPAAIHSKVVLIDDTVLITGSANAMRRSLYTDIELSALIIEEPTPRDLLPTSYAELQDPVRFKKREPSLVQSFRHQLWLYFTTARYRGNLIEKNHFAFFDIKKALKLWNRYWYPNHGFIPGAKHHEGIQPFPLTPFPDYGTFDQLTYDIEDPDSRQAF